MDVLKFLRPHIKSLKAYSSARDEFSEVNKDLTFIDANENPFQTCVNRYPDPLQNKLKNEWSKYIDIPVDQIMFGNGSDEVLDLIFRAFCIPEKDNVVILPPTYGMYEVLAQLNNIEVKKAELDENFQPNVASVLKQVNENTKLLFICSPNNPSANNLNENLIKDLITSFKGIIVIDEAYIDFSSQKSFVSYIEDYPNIIVTQTFSKAFGLAGIRLGICYGNPKIIDVFNKIKPPYNVNELTQKKALERLKNIDDVQKEVEKIIEQREFLIKHLKTINCVTKVFSSDANFILVRVDDANLRYNQLIDNGIVVRNRTTQPLCENCLRFTVGTKSENLKLISILKSF
ncbi:MAG: histidinol-phosphate transaminase [Flavobacteriaceae bacterium]